MNLYEKLLKIQGELKAPKGQFNSFGKYKYRSCEDILEAVKPLCVKYGLCLTLADKVELIGERYYIKATATVTDIEADITHSVSAYAREEENKKGMDSSQITGSASSYARKYALNGLFDIDDTKDADTDEQAKQTKQQSNKTQNTSKSVPVVKCPECGKEVVGYVGNSGKQWQPSEILSKYHMCVDCYKSKRK